MSSKTPIHDSPRERGVARLFAAGAALAGASLALALGARWLDWPWRRLAPFGFMAGGMVMLVLAIGYAYKAFLAEYWEWFRAGYARNERRAKEQVEGVQPRPGPPSA